MMKYMKFIDGIMGVLTTILVVLIITILVSQFNTVPRFFLVMAGFIIGMELAKFMNKRLSDMQDELIRSYKKLVEDILEKLHEIDEEGKKKVEEAQKAQAAAKEAAKPATHPFHSKSEERRVTAQKSSKKTN